jgi:hypothetical protein
MGEAVVRGKDASELSGSLAIIPQLANAYIWQSR